MSTDKIAVEQKIAKELLDSAKKLFINKNYEVARQIYESVITLDGGNAKAHYGRGSALGRLGRHQDALNAFEKAIELGLNDAVAHFNKGIALGRLGRHQDAVDAYGQAVRLKQDFAEAHNNRGIALGLLGDNQVTLGRREEASVSFTKAVDAFEKAIELSPNYAEVHYNKGYALRLLGRLQDAVDAYEQAIRFKLDFAEAHCGRGLALRLLGRLKDAVDAYEQAIRFKPDFAKAHNNRGNALRLLGDNQVTLGRREEALDSYREALKAFKEAIRLKPDYKSARSNKEAALRALVGFKDDLIGSRCYQELLDVCNEYIVLNPTNAEVNFARRCALGFLNEFQGALLAYQQVLDLTSAQNLSTSELRAPAIQARQFLEPLVNQSEGLTGAPLRAGLTSSSFQGQAEAVPFALSREPLANVAGVPTPAPVNPVTMTIVKTEPEALLNPAFLPYLFSGQPVNGAESGTNENQRAPNRPVFTWLDTSASIFTVAQTGTVKSEPAEGSALVKTEPEVLFNRGFLPDLFSGQPVNGSEPAEGPALKKPRTSNST